MYTYNKTTNILTHDSGKESIYDGSRDLKDGQELQDWEVREVWHYRKQGDTLWSDVTCLSFHIKFETCSNYWKSRGDEMHIALIDAEPEKLETTESIFEHNSNAKSYELNTSVKEEEAITNCHHCGSENIEFYQFNPLDGFNDFKCND